MTHDENTEFEKRSRGSKKPTLGSMQIYSKFDGFPLTFVHCLGWCLVMTPANTGSNYGGDVHSKSMKGCPWKGLQLTARHFVPGQWAWGTRLEIGRSIMGSELVEK